MSPSIIATRAPDWLSAMARLTATVVLPTPPLPAPTAMTFFTPGTGCFEMSPTAAGRTFAVIVTSTAVTPATRFAAAPAPSPTCCRHWEPKSGCSTLNDTRPPSIRRYFTCFSVTMSLPKSGSCTVRSASRTVFSESMSDSIGRHLPDERQFEFFPLVGLEHHEQPENGRQGQQQEQRH